MCSDTNRLTPSTDTIPGAPSLFLASRGLIPKLRKREGSPSRQYQSLQRCQLHSLISPEVSGVLQVQTLTKQCRERNPTLRNTHTHTDSKHGFFVARGAWSGPLTFIIDFLQDPSFYQLLSALSHGYFPFQGCKQNTEKQVWVSNKDHLKKKAYFKMY